MKYVLMRETREVLEFDVDLLTGAVHDVRPLEDASWAPLGVLDGPWQPEAGLSQFIEDRSISFNRTDLPAILEATGARSAIELAFASGGFSLFDPYWYRAQGSTITWERDNFFDNDWDSSFGAAVLREDYDALRKASVITPDVTCSGASRKAWLRDANGPRLFKAPVQQGSATVEGEVLISRMLARLLPESEFVTYELVERDGKTFSACRPMVSPGEELATALQVLAMVEGAPEDNEPADEPLGQELLEKFSFALAQLDIAGGSQMTPKMTVIAHLALSRDMHARNLGVIRDRFGALRLAPFFDFDRAFGLSDPDRVNNACANPQAATLMAARIFSNLDPSWDYAWYDKQALVGFEHEIESVLSACTIVPDGFAKLAADLFVAQREYVNHIVGN